MVGRGAIVEPGGVRFRAWAPRPRSIEVEIDGRRVALADRGGGLREAFVPGVGAGARYAYLLDGERRRPDPFSRAQPEGVHGPSEVVDPRAFRWSDGAFRAPPLADVVLYELHVGAFTRAGTFDAVAERLDDVAAAGANAVELMPVASFPGARNWGYDGVQWLAPQASYGGPERLRALVEACHRRGLAVVLDVVLNHLGPEGNYLAEFAPYFTPRHHTPWGDALDLDGADAGPVRDHLIDAALALVDEFHLDGLRLDAVHAFVDGSPVHVVAELAAALHARGAARGRPVWVIAESDLGSPHVVQPPAVGGWDCDAMWADDFHHALHAAVTGERAHYYADFGAPSLVARALERNLVQTGRHARFRGDRYGAPAAFLDGRTIVACAQNHDQVGNRARGERLSSLVPESLHAAAVALLTSPFLPLLFMGEEFGERAPFPYFTSFEDPQLARAVREGRRREYGEGAPDPQAPATFASAILDEARGGARGLLLRRFHRALAELRRERPSLGTSAPGRTEAVADGRAVVVRRTGDFDETLAVFVLGPSATVVELPAARRGSWRPLLDAADFGGPQGTRLAGSALHLPGWGALVLGSP